MPPFFLPFALFSSNLPILLQSFSPISPRSVNWKSPLPLKLIPSRKIHRPSDYSASLRTTCICLYSQFIFPGNMKFLSRHQTAPLKLIFPRQTTFASNHYRSLLEWKPAIRTPFHKHMPPGSMYSTPIYSESLLTTSFYPPFPTHFSQQQAEIWFVFSYILYILITWSLLTTFSVL